MTQLKKKLSKLTALTNKAMIVPLMSAAAFFILACVLFTAFVSPFINQQAINKSDTMSGELRSGLKKQIGKLRKQLQMLGKDEQIIQALQASNAELLQKQLAQLQEQFTKKQSALDELKIISRKQFADAPKLAAELGFANFHLYSLALSGKTPQLEVHHPGKSNERVYLAVPITIAGQQSDVAIGVLGAGFKPKLIDQMWKKLPEDTGYSELAQKVSGTKRAPVIYSQGEKRFRHGKPHYRKQIPNSSLVLSHWPSTNGMTGLYRLIYLVGTIAVAGVIFLAVRKKLSTKQAATDTEIDVITEASGPAETATPKAKIQATGTVKKAVTMEVDEDDEATSQPETTPAPASSPEPSPTSKTEITPEPAPESETETGAESPPAPQPEPTPELEAIEPEQASAVANGAGDNEDEEDEEEPVNRDPLPFTLKQPLPDSKDAEPTTKATTSEIPAVSLTPKPSATDTACTTAASTETSTVDQEIFRAYDIRGIVEKNLTEDTVFKIGQAIASTAKEANVTRIAVARDGRNSGPTLAKALANGIQAAGVNVTDLGAAPTPVLYFAAANMKAKSGVMLTGSHNPANYNGVKMVVNGETLFGDSIQALYQRIETNNLAEGEGEYKATDINDDYLQAIVKDINLGERKLKLVIDCGNGITGMLAPKLFEALGCEVIALYDEVNGDFPNHHPDPSVPENLQDLIASVAENHADLGFAFDGDGDRLGVVTSKGKIIWPDRLLMLYAEAVLKAEAGAQIVYDVKCSKHLQDFITQAKGQPLMWRTGHSFIKQKLKETGAKLAGEMSGHFFFNDRWFGFDDALYAGARLVEIISHTEQDTDAVFAELPDSISTPEIKIDIPEDRKADFVDDMVGMANFSEAELITIDGLRVEFNEGWGLVRASNTTPCLVCRFEADSEEALEKIKDEFRKLLLRVDDSLKIPF